MHSPVTYPIVTKLTITKSLVIPLPSKATVANIDSTLKREKYQLN